jgi:hypothetical protein
MSPFIVEAKRILGPVLAASSKSTMQAPFGRASFTAPPSGSALAVLGAFVGGAALMALLGPKGRTKAVDSLRRLVKGAPREPEGAIAQADPDDERPSGAME